MEFQYKNIEYNCLVDYLENPEIAIALAYMLEFKEHKNLKVITHNHAIEISNESITIFVILYIDFMFGEFQNLQSKHNIHYVSFFPIMKGMNEFETINLKLIDKHSLVFNVMSRSKESLLETLYRMLNLNL